MDSASATAPCALAFEMPTADVGKCCRLTKAGGRCQWLLGSCKVHSALEGKDMTREDVQSQLVNGRLCGVQCPIGRLCTNGKFTCNFHATGERQCASTKDDYPDKRCSLAKVADSSYCAQHQPFPNLGFELRAYLRDDRNGFNEFLKSRPS